MRRDPALAKTLAGLDPEAPLPSLWPFFEGLRRVPVLALRGEHSDILTPETLSAMGDRHPGLEEVVVPGQELGRDLDHEPVPATARSTVSPSTSSRRYSR